MSLTKNIGIGKEAFYNPFNHYKGDGEDWFKKMLELGIFPKEIAYQEFEWRLEHTFDSLDMLIIHIVWGERAASMYVHTDKKYIEVTSSAIGLAIAEYMKKMNPDVHYMKLDDYDYSSVYIGYESCK